MKSSRVQCRCSRFSCGKQEELSWTPELGFSTQAVYRLDQKNTLVELQSRSWPLKALLQKSWNCCQNLVPAGALLPIWSGLDLTYHGFSDKLLCFPVFVDCLFLCFMLFSAALVDPNLCYVMDPNLNSAQHGGHVWVYHVWRFVPLS